MSDNRHLHRADKLLAIAKAGFEEVLASAGIPAPETLADKLVVSLHQTLGGQQLYITKPQTLAVSATHAKLYAKFTGANHESLASEFNLSLRHVYRIVEMCQLAEFQNRQNPLL